MKPILFLGLLASVGLVFADESYAPPFEKPTEARALAKYQKRLAFWKNREETRDAVVFVGDSITEWWTGLAAHFPGLKVANRGIAGDTTFAVRERLDVDVLDLKPKAVVLLLGTNDINSGWAEESEANATVVARKTMERFDGIVQRIRERAPDAPLVIGLLLPRDKPPGPDPKLSYRNAAIQPFNQMLRERYQDDPNIRVVDTYSPFVGETGELKDELFKDRLHPNEKGYDALAETLRPVFKDIDLLP